MSESFGISTIIQAIQQIAQSANTIANNISALVIGPSANNKFTGNNTFTGTNSFDPPPTISAGDAGAGTLLPSGLVSVQTSVAGNGNVGNTTDNTLFTYTLPAGSLDIVGRTVVVEAFGSFAGNGDNKTVKIWVGSAVWFTTGVVTLNGVSWQARIQLSKAASNSQVGYAIGFAAGAAAPLEVNSLSGTQTDTAPIVIRVTGASPTSGIAGDVVANGMTVFYMN